MASVELTPDQAEALDMFFVFMGDKRAKTMSLQGKPGVGKSWLTQELVKRLPHFTVVAATATTHAAVEVLSEFLSAAGVEVAHTSTIHSLLGLRMLPNGDLKELSRGGVSKVPEFDLVIVDEGSQVNEALNEYIREDSSTANTKFLFIGDICQINPVNEMMSKVFEWFDYSAVLTEIVRQQERNPILKLASAFREAIDTGGDMPEVVTAKGVRGEGVYVLPKAKFESWMRAGFNSKAYEDKGSKAFMTLAWRNRRCDHYNSRIREVLYGEEAVNNPFLVGERVITSEPIMDGDDIAVPNNCEGTVRDVVESTHPEAKRRRWGEFKTLKLSVWYPNIGLITSHVIHEDSERAWDNKLSSFSREAKKDSRLWGTFWAAKQSVAVLKPSHARTLHKSQGRSCESVFLDLGDASMNRNYIEMLRCVYVGISRASKNLMVLL